MKYPSVFTMVAFWSALFFLFSCENINKEMVATEKVSVMKTRFELSDSTETATYEEGIAFFEDLAKRDSRFQIRTMGEADSGLPIHLVWLTAEGENKISRFRNRPVLLINNAIHPGEPDGVDACMMLFRDLLALPSLRDSIGDLVIAAIPFYNIGGALNRNSTSRVNQQGPKEYGFRGNASNYDLNRDFIKADSKNALAFSSLFHRLNPDVFIDTHVSNGADYQHVITNLPTQEDKLGGKLASYMTNTFTPLLDSLMKKEGFPMCPYVNVFGTTPDAGFNQFMDLPRYSTGYASLFHTISFMTETHMLKPFGLRVSATYAYLRSVISIMKQEGQLISRLRSEDIATSEGKEEEVISWELDKSAYSLIPFQGYEASYIKSKISGKNTRLFYDRSKPYTKEIPYYNHFKPSVTVARPAFYLISKSWENVLERLRINGITFDIFRQDEERTVSAYEILGFQTYSQPYEGHYLHYNTKVKKVNKKVLFRKGDYIIPANQPGIRYLMATLEPQAPDSFFNWNFFDIVLQRKEGFSPYVFEDIAEKLLKEDAKLKAAFQRKMKEDKDFAADAYQQLNYIYTHSDHHEEAYMQYPVYRVELP